MKSKTLSIMFICLMMLLLLFSCNSKVDNNSANNIDEEEVANIAESLFKASLLGENWDGVEPLPYYPSLSAFYCAITNDDSEEIPATSFETIITKYFDVTNDYLRDSAANDFDINKEIYLADMDQVSAIVSRTTDDLTIDNIESSGDTVTISYHTVLGAMAEAGDENKHVFDGEIKLIRNEDIYRIKEIIITTNNNND